MHPFLFSYFCQPYACLQGQFIAIVHTDFRQNHFAGSDCQLGHREIQYIIHRIECREQTFQVGGTDPSAQVRHPYGRQGRAFGRENTVSGDHTDVTIRQRDMKTSHSQSVATKTDIGMQFFEIETGIFFEKRKMAQLSFQSRTVRLEKTYLGIQVEQSQCVGLGLVQSRSREPAVPEQDGIDIES